MPFVKVLKLLLIFFGLSKKYADTVVQGACQGCIVTESNNTLNITTTVEENLEG